MTLPLWRSARAMNPLKLVLLLHKGQDLLSDVAKSFVNLVGGALQCTHPREHVAPSSRLPIQRVGPSHH